MGEMGILYHYTLQKEDKLWDCVSETIPEDAKQKDLGKVHKFDWCVKQSFEEGAPYLGAIQNVRKYGFYLSHWKKVYDRYFSDNMKLEGYLSKSVKDRFEKAGDETSGYEFSSGKFYSVASSSRFAVASFTKEKDGELDYIDSIKINGNEEKITAPYFEYDTRVTGIGKDKHCPQLDFFFKTNNGTFFIEVKNHEILDSHKSIELSPSYLKTDAFEHLGVKGQPCAREYTDSKGEVHPYISLVKHNNGKKHFLLASDFDCNLKTFHFDFKQFLCHLMGIWSYAEKNPTENVYFYYLIYRNKPYEKYFDINLYNELEAEVKNIFVVFQKRFPNIHFGLCYHNKYDTVKELIAEIGE